MRPFIICYPWSLDVLKHLLNCFRITTHLIVWVFIYERFLNFMTPKRVIRIIIIWNLFILCVLLTFFVCLLWLFVKPYRSKLLIFTFRNCLCGLILNSKFRVNFPLILVYCQIFLKFSRLLFFLIKNLNKSQIF